MCVFCRRSLGDKDGISIGYQFFFQSCFFEGRGEIGGVGVFEKNQNLGRGWGVPSAPLCCRWRAEECERAAVGSPSNGRRRAAEIFKK